MKITYFQEIIVGIVLTLFAPVCATFFNMYTGPHVEGAQYAQFLLGACTFCTAYDFKKNSARLTSQTLEQVLRFSYNLLIVSILISFVMFAVYQLGTPPSTEDLSFKDWVSVAVLFFTLIWNAGQHATLTHMLNEKKKYEPVRA